MEVGAYDEAFEIGSSVSYGQSYLGKEVGEMCNFIHEEKENKFEEIPETGYGWKILGRTVGKKVLYAGICDTPYRSEDNKTVEWDTHNYDGDGFCFFGSKEEADSAMEWNWVRAIPNIKVYKIKYEIGLGSFIETSDHSFGDNTRLYLCKKFTVLFDEEE